MKKETRVAHSDGITDVTLTPDGEKLITCGNDGDVRIWESFADEDPITFSASDSCFGIVSNLDKVIVGTENNSVEFYQLPKGKSLGNKIKFTGAANHVDITKDGKVLVAGSADKTIQVLTLEDSSSPPVKIEAHSGPVLSVAIDPLKKFIVSSGCDGNVFIWSFDDPKQSVKRWTNVFPSSNDITTSSTLCRMAWNPVTGKQLAVPIKDKIMIYERDTWNELQSLTCSKLTKFFSVVCFSSCGSFIGAGGFDGLIAIWDITKEPCSLLVQLMEANHITGVSFNNKNDQLFCTDCEGRLVCIKEFSGDQAEADSGSAVSPTSSLSVSSKSTSSKNQDNEVNDVFDDGMDDLFTGGDDDDENSISISKIKAETGWVDDEYVGISKAKGALSNGVGGPSTNNEDNDDARSVSSLASSKISRIIQPPPTIINPFTTPQEPFQPSSTPDHLEHRFLTWNNIGIMRSYSTQDEEFNEDAIDIEFHDANFHHEIHLQNKFDFCIGNMSTELVALGCRKSPESNSKLFCHVFSSWDSSKDWTVDLPRDEEIAGIALGTGWLVAATDDGRLRLFSTGGVQKFIYDLPGSIVAISAHENLLFVTYHGVGVGTGGNQNIFYSIFKVFAESSRISPLVLDAPLPLSRKSILAWIGFTDEGTPVFSDSKNVLRILHGRLWSPFCHMKEHVTGHNGHFWVVGVSETSSQVRAIKCKGSTFPAAIPRPTIMMLDAKLPLCEMDTEKSKLEDAMLQSLWLASISKKMEKKGYDVQEFKDKATVESKEKLFKLFVMACKANCEFRASEYVSMMPSAHAMQVAIKYANTFNHRTLIGRLETMGRKKMSQEGEIEEEFDDFEFTQIVTHVEHRRHATVGSGTEFNHLYSEEEHSHTSYSNGGFRSSRGINGSHSNSNSADPVIIEDNPLLRRQKDEIRSIISSVPVRRNPFKKGLAQQNGELSASSSSLTRQTSFGFSQNSSMDEDSQKFSSSHSHGLDISDDNSNGGLSVSKGMSKIDVWSKPKEKKDTLPEFNPKDPNRKSKSSSSSSVAGNGKESGPGGKGRKSNPFEKKSSSKNLQDNDKDKKKPKQRTLFDMGGTKKGSGSKSSSNNTIELDDGQDVSVDETSMNNIDAENGDSSNSIDAQQKKRKRSTDDDLIDGETDKNARAKITASEDDD